MDEDEGPLGGGKFDYLFIGCVVLFLCSFVVDWYIRSAHCVPFVVDWCVRSVQ